MSDRAIRYLDWLDRLTMPKNRVNRKEIKQIASKVAMSGHDELLMGPKRIHICGENRMGSDSYPRGFVGPLGQIAHVPIVPNSPIYMGCATYALDPLKHT